VCCGWPAEGEKKTHTFKNLVGSDHTELLLTDGSSNTVMHFKIDLISESDESACGYETLDVLDGDGEWDSPYCPPGTPGCSEGGNPPSGGQGDAECPPNQQLSDTGTEMICTPIPFANYPGMAACPEGYVIDVANEGRYCLPVEP
jgi:hypothetical protein